MFNWKIICNFVRDINKTDNYKLKTMDNKQKMMVLAGIGAEEKFRFIISYDINEDDDQYFHDISEILINKGGIIIHESLYGFEDTNSTELLMTIINLLNGNKHSDKTHIKMITAKENELQLTSIIN